MPAADAHSAGRMAIDLKTGVWVEEDQWERSSDAIDLWRIPLRDRPTDVQLLSFDERARAERRKIPEKQDQLIAGRAALRRVLGRYLGRSANSLEFGYGEHGRPYLLGDDKGLDFNLSHSEEMALVGVSAVGRIGVDVEWRRLGRPFDRLAERFFSPREWTDYQRLTEIERIDAFYRLWCRKEAYLKAHGTGLSFSSRAFTVAVAPDETPWLRSTEMPSDRIEAWSAIDLELGKHYDGAVCFEGRPVEIRLFAHDPPVPTGVSLP